MNCFIKLKTGSNHSNAQSILSIRLTVAVYRSFGSTFQGHPRQHDLPKFDPDAFFKKLKIYDAHLAIRQQEAESKKLFKKKNDGSFMEDKTVFAGASSLGFAKSNLPAQFEVLPGLNLYKPPRDDATRKEREKIDLEGIASEHENRRKDHNDHSCISQIDNGRSGTEVGHEVQAEFMKEQGIKDDWFAKSVDELEVNELIQRVSDLLLRTRDYHAAIWTQTVNDLRR